MTKAEMINKLLEVMSHNPCINIAKQRKYYNLLSKAVIKQEYDYYVDHEADEDF